MPSFQYKAKQKDANTVSGQIIASDKDDAIEKINQLGLIPVTIEEVRLGKGTFARSIKPKVLYRFSRHLMNLLKGGVPILRALEVIAAQEKNVHFKNIVQSLHMGIHAGKSLSDCLAEYPFVFPPLYTAMVRVGEESGRLKEIFAELAEYLSKQEEVRVKVQNALIYPALMAILGLGSVIFILTYVLPKLTVVYDQFQQTLPLPTLMVMRISRFLLNGWPWIALVIVFGMGIFNKWGKTPQAQMKLSRIKLKVPVIGQFLLKVEMMRFCKTVELLLRSGISVVRALHFSVAVVDNELLKQELKKARESLEAGRSLGEALKGIPVIPPMIGFLISVGEESGNITESLHDIAENYQQETEEAVKILTTLLEPLMIICVGAVIGFIVIAMLLPIFQLDMIIS